MRLCLLLAWVESSPSRLPYCCFRRRTRWRGKNGCSPVGASPASCWLDSSAYGETTGKTQDDPGSLRCSTKRATGVLCTGETRRAESGPIRSVRRSCFGRRNRLRRRHRCIDSGGDRGDVDQSSLRVSSARFESIPARQLRVDPSCEGRSILLLPNVSSIHSCSLPLAGFGRSVRRYPVG